MFIAVFAGIFTWNLIKGDLDSVAKQAVPFVIMDVMVLILLSLFPWFSLYLPTKAGLYSP